MTTATFFPLKTNLQQDSTSAQGGEEWPSGSHDGRVSVACPILQTWNLYAGLTQYREVSHI